jgi:hypothetical protein
MSTRINYTSSAGYIKVNTYADLPSATAVPEKIYVVLTTDSGKPSGFYYSDGSSWFYLVDVTGGTTSNWGSLVGDVNDQTDLIELIDTKEDIFVKGNLVETGTSSLTITGGSGAVIGSGVTIELPQNIKTDSEVEFQKVTMSGIVMVDNSTITDFLYNAGSIIPPTLLDNGNGTATISESTGYIFSSTDYSGTLLKGHVAEQTLTFTDGAEEYVVVDYNNGNPIMRVETNKFLINGSNIITLFIVWRQGNVIHSINQGAYGLGLTNKINRVMYNTESYKRSVDGGLILSITNTPAARTVLVSSSIVYAGSTSVVVNAFNSSTDLLTEAVNTNGTWSYTNVSVYDNISYNPILTGKAEANDNKYITRWFYRSIGDAKQVFYVMGNNYYNKVLDAEGEAQPTIPILLKNHCMLIGKIIIQKGLDTYKLYSAFDVTFIGSEVIHNDTAGLQGGTNNEYYHLTSAEHGFISGSNAQSLLTTSSPTFSGMVINGIDIENDYLITKEPTGFTEPENIVVSFNSTTKTITLTGTVEAYWRGKLITELVSGWESSAIPGTPLQPYYLYYDGSNFVWSTDFWTFDKVQIAYVYYKSDGTYLFTLKETHGFMSWQDHTEFHQIIGTYKTAGGTLTNFNLNSTVATDKRPDTSSTTLKDEDMSTVCSAKTDKLYTQVYLSSTGLITAAIDQADIVPVSGNQPYYNSWNGSSWVQTLMSNNTYMSVWKVAMTCASDAASQKFRYFWVQGQSEGNLITQQALTPQNLNIGNLNSISAEYVFIAKVIIQYTSGNWKLIQVDYLSGNRFIQTSFSASNYLATVEHTTSFTGDGTTTTPLAINFETSTANIKMDDGVSVGTLNTIARADHIHPSDTSKVNLSLVGPASGQIPLSNGVLNSTLNADLLDGYHVGTLSGQIPLSNGVLNSTLNADLLDNYHAGNLSGQIPISNGIINTYLNTGMLSGATLSTDVTLAADSDFLIPSQKAVKTYVDDNAGGSTLLYLEQFTTTSGQVDYTLTNTPIGVDYTFVNINGRNLDPQLFTISGNTLTLLEGAGSQRTLDGRWVTTQYPEIGDRVIVNVIKNASTIAFDPTSIAALVDNTINGSKIIDDTILSQKLVNVALDKIALGGTSLQYLAGNNTLGTIGNSSGVVPISNGILNAGLNADLLDGAHLSTDTSLTNDSDAYIPSQKAVKAYSDTKIPKANYLGVTTLSTSTATQAIDWTTTTKVNLTLNQSVTLTFTPPTLPTTLILMVVQGGSGSYTITWPTIKWMERVTPVLTTNVGYIDMISLYYDGTNYYGMIGNNFG